MKRHSYQAVYAAKVVWFGRGCITSEKEMIEESIEKRNKYRKWTSAVCENVGGRKNGEKT